MWPQQRTSAQQWLDAGRSEAWSEPRPAQVLRLDGCLEFAPAPASTRAGRRAHWLHTNGARAKHEPCEVERRLVEELARNPRGGLAKIGAPQPRSEEASSTATPDQDEDEDTQELGLLIRMEGLSSSTDVLRAACEDLASCRPETVVVALHLAAKHLPSDASAAEQVTSSKDLATLLAHLCAYLPQVRSPRLLSRLAWTLGKLEVTSRDADVAVSHICNAAIGILPKFTAQDLTNTLWGLARLRSPNHAGGRGRSAAAVTRLAQAIVHACAQRVPELTSQCIANAFWAVARLRLRLEHVRDLVEGCLVELSGGRQLRAFTPQGLANIVWALAELCGDSAARKGESLLTAPWRANAVLVFTSVAVEALGRIDEFQPQELSMLAWACAKFHGRARPPTARGRGGRCRPGAEPHPAEIEALLLGIARQGSLRLAQLSAQSVSNIAWALGTCGLLKPGEACAPARAFLCDAMAMAERQLDGYAPQAVANLIWAAVRLISARDAEDQGEREAFEAFSVVVARHATLQMLGYSWRDLAGISVALAYTWPPARETLTFMTLVVGQAAAHCYELSPQMMLNIARAAVRLELPLENVQSLVDAIAHCMGMQQLHLNDADSTLR